MSKSTIAHGLWSSWTVHVCADLAVKVNKPHYIFMPIVWGSALILNWQIKSCEIWSAAFGLERSLKYNVSTLRTFIILVVNHPGVSQRQQDTIDSKYKLEHDSEVTQKLCVSKGIWVKQRHVVVTHALWITFFWQKDWIRIQQLCKLKKKKKQQLWNAIPSQFILSKKFYHPFTHLLPLNLI